MTAAALITADGRFPLNLTGPQSHVLIREPGVGSLTIGPASMGKRADLHVEPDARIDWRVLDAFGVGAGGNWPYWPRHLYYTGSDTSFLVWARDRPIEDMTWTPVLAGDHVIDASQARIHDLRLRLDQPGGQLHLKLPEPLLFKSPTLDLSGDLSRISVEGDLRIDLILRPRTSRRRTDAPCRLPDLGAMKQATALTLYNEPLAQPISLDFLADFPNVRSVCLWGNFTDLDGLAQRPELTSLGMRYMPNLDGLPSLDTWPDLRSFIGFNVDETAGKALRQQVKARARKQPWIGHTSVTMLRKPEWWEKEYGRPFSGWPARQSKRANAAYDEAQAALAQAGSEADAQRAFTDFAAGFNGFKGIETTEREDIGEAVWQLAQTEHLSALGVTEEKALQWFDESRDY